MLDSAEFILIRRIFNLSQAQFAKLIGVSVSEINKLEKNSNDISINIIYKSYVEMLIILKIKDDLNLNEVEIFGITKFLEKLSNQINIHQKAHIKEKEKILLNRK